MGSEQVVAPENSPRRANAESPDRPALYVLPVLSGAAGLIFEVLWLKDLAVVFGNTASAAAAVLSVFFLGLATGGRYWGRRCDRASRPLRLYGFLELAVAGSALFFMGLLAAYRQLYEPIFDALPLRASAAAKMLLAALVLLPPAFFMGGTLPALAQRVARTPVRLGRSGSALYGLNTIGAAGGALLAGFFLPPLLGFRASYWVAIAGATVAGLTALALDRERPDPHLAHPTDTPERAPVAGTVSARVVWLIAFLSGFLTLGMQVLWTRLLAQVLNNSTYAFSAILVTFLVALGLGPLLTRVTLRRPASALPALYWTLGLSGGAALLSSLLFVRVTRGLVPLAVGPDWPQYLGSVFAASAVLVFLPVLLMGMVLPLLFFIAQGEQRGPGHALGRLLAINSLGSVAGALITAFVLLDWIGYWGSLRLLSASYLVLSAVVMVGATRDARGVRAAGLTALALIAAIAIPRAQPVVNVTAGERLIEVTEGSGGTVAVLRSGENLVMRLNNSYVLGDTKSFAVEQLQGHLPLLLHPAPSDVFFLGLGTGISAGAALDHPLKRIVAAELLPEVIDAARKHYGSFVNGLFEDDRVRIVADDGRSFLAGKSERYDVIVSDLFTPWHAGTGSLYTFEHFSIVRKRLRPDGIFAQWLPLFQMSRAEFLVIARTMQAVFPQVTVWRGNFSATEPILALVAQTRLMPLDQTALMRSAERLPSRTGTTTAQDHMVGLFYAGNLRGLRTGLATQPINTDDRPIIEYLAPRLQAERDQRFVGVQLDEFLQLLLDSLPPERDPVLAGLPAREREYVQRGLDFFRYHLYSAQGRPDSAALFLERFRRAVGTFGSREQITNP